MDHLSLALAATHIRGSLLATLDLAAPWSIDFQQAEGVPVHYVVEGDALLTYGDAPARWVKPGDLLMFTRWDRHTMSSGPEAGDAMTISDIVIANGHKPWTQGERLEEPLALNVRGSGPSVRLFSMVVELDRSVPAGLLDDLPGMIHVAAQDVAMEVWLKPVLQFLASESEVRQPGYAIVQSRLAELLFMQIVRSQLLMRPSDVPGTIRLLLDPLLGKVATATRERPGERWTVASMARVAGLSRSGFARRFADLAGATPMDFVRGLRLDLAAQRLRQGDRIKSLVAPSGYRTAYSFAKAFRARFELSPSVYRAKYREVL